MRLQAFLLAVLLAPGSLPGAEQAATAGTPKRTGSMRELVQARMLAEAKKKQVSERPAPPQTVPAAAPVDSLPAAAPAAAVAPAADGPAAAPAVVLPPVEVRKGRITELDQQLARQDHAIAREKAALVASEPDKAMNDAKIARPLAIFGGESTQFRQHVASERVELMEAEKDLMEAIAHARTQAEKDELQKQLNELKAIRRELDRTLR